MRAEEYPAHVPMKTYRTKRVVRRAPRLAGEVSPRRAQIIEANVMARIWRPDPDMTESSIGDVDGGLL